MLERHVFALLLLLLHDHVQADRGNSGAEPATSFTAFVEWAREGLLCDALDLRLTDSGMQVVAVRDLRENDTILFVPPERRLRPSTWKTHASEERKALMWRASDMLSEKFADGPASRDATSGRYWMGDMYVAVLQFWLEYVRATTGVGEARPPPLVDLAPWLRSYRYAKLAVPRLWTHEEIDWIRGRDFAREILKYLAPPRAVVDYVCHHMLPTLRRQFRSQFPTARVAHAGEIGWEISGGKRLFSCAGFEWAAQLFQPRQFVPASLVPVADMLDHGSVGGLNVRMSMDGERGAFRMTARRHVRAGELLVNRYREPSPNSFYLALWDFTTQPPEASVSVPVGPWADGCGAAGDCPAGRTCRLPDDVSWRVPAEPLLYNASGARRVSFGLLVWLEVCAAADHETRDAYGLSTPADTLDALLRRAEAAPAPGPAAARVLLRWVAATLWEIAEWRAGEIPPSLPTVRRDGMLRVVAEMEEVLLRAEAELGRELGLPVSLAAPPPPKGGSRTYKRSRK